ncbi:isoleucine--tRNA ligase [Saccharopolyspora sp. WRP15-2]|uniref:Isoleucine--tRNA ligase n=1 Tax=Saccharopolyspora oryzae TaxID=2997343 RepID=A0ABT4V6T0_9PSEU|nr:isoleucine--tRNA ligase [Saccharopolyspora oryzae]MDA3629675.1 isoleucine--tRNA ligase [Saccharopolyspora oryzae]
MAQPGSPFHPLEPAIDLPAMERQLIEWWHAHEVFERSLAQTADGPRWVFYEGPPTANGVPGTHHVEARVFKDVFPRFKTMKGCNVPRRGGWDCHGLPVELAVEKELGISGKPDIERIGIAEFNARCRASVQRHVGEFETVTRRMGYWIDLSAAYWTMSPDYVDSVWWALKRIFDAGLLVEDYRVAPYCPRDQTTLSDHEVAQGYEPAHDPSVFVRFPLDEPLAGHHDVDLLIWTTTPWTLVSNTAVAVHPAVDYQVVRTVEGTFVVAEPLVESVLGPDGEVLATLPGTELAGLHYRRPFDLVDIPDAHRVVLAEYVSTEDGTGLVHQAPAFGADDLAVCRENGLPVVNPVGTDGRFDAEVGLVGGMFFKDADAVLVEDLQHRGLLLRYTTFEHQYPHCWRCHTPLMYYAQLSWYIRTTAIREALQRENERTDWYPEHVKHGRYGDWLDNNVDWALSRTRYWGTPLPLWRCPDGHVTPIGSRAELGERTGQHLTELDPHRPYLDEIEFPCPTCGKSAARVPEVVDAWFDSGSMPFAQLGYPHQPGSVAELARSYPAQYICEAIDQTRGWFYTLMAVGTLLFDRSAYETVVCLGHIVAEDGRKMSKHLGNVLEPLPLMEEHGADALRWFMLCSGSPWSARRVGHAPLREIVRKVLLTYWNTASFFSRYAALVDWIPADAAPPEKRPVLDRWVLAQLHRLAAEVDARLEDYDTAGAGRSLAEFVDDLSNWYVRRSRQRFWDGDPNALRTLYDCLDVLTRLLAPFVPFIAERVWQDVVRPGAPDSPESVHLATWPRADLRLVDDRLLSLVDTERQLAEAGRAARKSSGIKVRQPLGRALVSAALPPELVADLADELNVRRIEPLESAGEVLDVSVKPNFRALGARFGNRTQLAAAAVNAADPAELARTLRTGAATIEVDGQLEPLTGEDVFISEVPRTGWVVESQRDVTIALDTTITPELERAGLAREVIRFVQDCRKQDGLDITDRITLHWRATGELREALRHHAEEIATAVLATATTESASPAPDSTEHTDPTLDLTIWLHRT